MDLTTSETNLYVLLIHSRLDQTETSTNGEIAPSSHLAEDEDMNASFEIVKSLRDLETFDAQLRNELDGSAIVTKVDNDGNLLPPFPRPMPPTAESIQDYLEAVLRITKAVRSSTFTSFWTTAHQVQNGGSIIHEEPCQDPSKVEPHMYVHYLLPNLQHDPRTFHTIPRTGSYTRTLDNVLPGWWIVWQFSMVSTSSVPLDLGGQVEFRVCTRSSNAVDSSKTVSVSHSDDDDDDSTIAALLEEPTTPVVMAHELVHRELCSISSHHPFVGSYRVVDECQATTTAMLEFSLVGGTLSSWVCAATVTLECAAVPHEAFRAACQAAQDQNEANFHRQRRSPLLNAILDATHVKLVVEPYVSSTPDSQEKSILDTREDKGVAVPTSERELQNVNDSANGEDLQSASVEYERLRKEKASLSGELKLCYKTLNETTQKMESEQQMWQLARDAMQRELARLSEQITVERIEKSELASRVDGLTQTVQELQGKMELQISRGEDLDSQPSIASDTDTTIIDMTETIGILEKDVAALTGKNMSLEDNIIQLNNTQGILERNLQRLEQELGRISSKRTKLGMLSRKSSLSSQIPSLDKSILAFQHPDARLNHQLCKLRDSHFQLVKLLNRGPSNAKNVELLSKIEKAILDIIASASKTAEA